jgi:hydrogenase nickel incorporation protein HypA/HybF
MHEVGVAEEILENAVAAAREALGAAARVEALRVRVGEFSGVDLEALRFALEVLSRGGPAENCSIELIGCPLTLSCVCGRVAGGEEMRGRCPECGAQSWKVTGGRDLVLEGVEAIGPDDPAE